MHGAFIHRDLLNPAMRHEQNRPAWRFVNAARFHADKAVFQQIQATNAVSTAEFVQLGQEGCRAHFNAVKTDRITTLKAHFDIGRCVWCVFRANRALIDKSGRFIIWVFEDFAFGRGMQQVRINRKGRFAALVFCNLNAVFFGIFDQLRPGIQIPLPPRRNDFDVRIERVIAEFKPDLIIPFTRRAMTHGVSADFVGDLDLAF